MKDVNPIFMCLVPQARMNQITRTVTLSRRLGSKKKSKCFQSYQQLQSGLHCLLWLLPNHIQAVTPWKRPAPLTRGPPSPKYTTTSPQAQICPNGTQLLGQSHRATMERNSQSMKRGTPQPLRPTFISFSERLPSTCKLPRELVSSALPF